MKKELLPDHLLPLGPPFLSNWLEKNYYFNVKKFKLQLSLKNFTVNTLYPPLGFMHITICALS
jgi:hypothetical protein